MNVSSKLVSNAVANPDTQAAKRFKRYEGYAMYVRHKIWSVASARERDFTAQMVCWHCAVAYIRGNTSCNNIPKIWHKETLDWTL